MRRSAPKWASRLSSTTLILLPFETSLPVQSVSAGFSVIALDHCAHSGSARTQAKHEVRVMFSVVSRAPAPDLAASGRGQHRFSRLLLAHGPVPWIGGTDRRRPGRKASLLRAAAGPGDGPFDARRDVDRTGTTEGGLLNRTSVTILRARKCGIAVQSIEWLSARDAGSTPRASRARNEETLTATQASIAVPSPLKAGSL